MIHLKFAETEEVWQSIVAIEQDLRAEHVAHYIRFAVWTSGATGVRRAVLNLTPLQATQIARALLIEAAVPRANPPKETA